MGNRNGKKQHKSTHNMRRTPNSFHTPYLQDHSRNGDSEELSVHIDIADEEFALLKQGKKFQLASGHIGGTPIEITIQRIKPKKKKGAETRTERARRQCA